MSIYLPRWSDLPCGPFFNKEMTDYINKTFDFFLNESGRLTPTMVQNYVKWEMLPCPSGRKYTKKHLAYLIVISILKDVLTIQEVHQGIYLSLQLMSVEQAYNVFSSSLEKQNLTIRKTVHQKCSPCTSLFSDKKTIAIDCAVASFLYQFYTRKILSVNGYQNFKKEFTL